MTNISIKEIPAAISTRMDPISGLEEAYLHGELVGMFSNEADAWKYLQKKLAALPVPVIVTVASNAIVVC